MAAGDVSITRGIGFRDDFLDVSAWTADAGVTGTTDGDILTLLGTTATNGFSRTITGSPSTTTYPNLIIRIKAASAMNFDVKLTFGDATTQTQTVALTTNLVATTFSLTTGKTVSSIKFQNQTVTGNINTDFFFIFKETLTLPAVSQPLQFTLSRYVIELPIPTREGGALQDLGSSSAQIEVAGTLITTTSPNNYTGDQWWDVLVGTWLEANWQWLSSDRVSYKYQIEELSPKQDPGKVGYYGFKLRLRKVDILSATAQTFGSATGAGAIQ